MSISRSGLAPSLGAACVAMLCASAGCMLTPVNEEIVASRDATITFSGYDLEPGRWIRVMAYHPKNKRFQYITSTYGKTDGQAIAQWPGSELFFWSRKRVIPREYWQPGARGYRTRVKAQTAVNDTWQNMISVDDDWGDCLETTSSPNEFGDKCASEESPQAWVYTKDYCRDLGTGGKVVNRGASIWQKIVDGQVQAVQVYASVRLDIAPSKIEDFEGYFDKSALGIDSLDCFLDEWNDGTGDSGVVCTCSGSACGELASKRATEVFAGPVRFDWSVAVKDGSVPTRCGMYSDSHDLTYDDIEIVDGKTIPDPPPPEPKPIPDGPKPGQGGASKRICAGFAVPLGYIMTNNEWDPNRKQECGNATWNIHVVSSYTHLEVGESMPVCHPAPTPPGFVVDSTWSNPNFCHGMGTTNMKTIRRVD